MTQSLPEPLHAGQGWSEGRGVDKERPHCRQNFGVIAMTYEEFQKRLNEIDRRISDARWNDRNAEDLYRMRDALVAAWQEKPES
jgi:hypothetical protein